MKLFIRTESETFTARELWVDSMDAFTESKLLDIESSEDGKIDAEAVLACYSHFYELYGDIRPVLESVSEDGRVARIKFIGDDWSIECYLQ
jgi:hypothetical protein